MWNFSSVPNTLNEDNKNIEDALFDMFRTDDTVPIGKFLAVNICIIIMDEVIAGIYSPLGFKDLWHSQ